MFCRCRASGPAPPRVIRYDRYAERVDGGDEAAADDAALAPAGFDSTRSRYQHVDAVLAIRDCPPVVLATKPASKLINAWKAGVPALLGPEPAYRELRTSPLDFLEAASAEAVLDSIDRLQQESGLYRRMTEHGAKRAQAFDVNMLTQKWISLLEEARERNRRETLHPVMRSIRYLWNRQKINLGKRLSGWRD